VGIPLQYKIASWNVNSVGARLEHLLQWMQDFQPDVVLLQELKGIEETFPFAAIEALGYTAAVYGQKAYNGVAIVSKHPLTAIKKGIPNFTDENARYIEAVVADKFTVASIYVPNGQDLDSEKFTYKMAFYQGLTAYLATIRTQEMPYILGGDFNVAHQPLDCYAPEKFKNRLLFSQPERHALQRILNLGFTDTYRVFHKETRAFSWWDYREGRFDRDEGLRIDYLFTTPEATDLLVESGIDTLPRGLLKPSDHTPVWCTIVVSI
jgi:exodeoxyribonuclease-3